MSKNELDFDELDKAVSSLMGGVKEKDNLPSSKTLDINETLAPDEAPAYGKLDHTAEGIGSEAIDRHEQTVSIEETDETPELDTKPSIDAVPVAVKTPGPAPAPAAATATPSKRSGRFMDVVHPSSDMKSAEMSKPAAAKVSHEAATIETTSKVETPAIADIPDSTEGNLPDDTEPVIELSDDVVEAEPQSSPFLPDAKVEKRPLGGTGEIKIDELDELEPDHKKDDEFSKMDAMNEPARSLTEVTEHIPEEFEDELIAVEKGSTDEETAKDETKKSDSHGGSTSIPKQYKEKESTGDHTNGSIYDTKHYHKPVAQAEEKSSGWLWFIVVLILIIIGGGLGAAVYFFDLI